MRNEPEPFKVGDRVRHRKSGVIGTITHETYIGGLDLVWVGVTYDPIHGKFTGECARCPEDLELYSGLDQMLSLIE